MYIQVPIIVHTYVQFPPKYVPLIAHSINPVKISSHINPMITVYVLEIHRTGSIVCSFEKNGIEIIAKHNYIFKT